MTDLELKIDKHRKKALWRHIEGLKVQLADKNLAIESLRGAKAQSDLEARNTRVLFRKLAESLSPTTGDGPISEKLASCATVAQELGLTEAYSVELNRFLAAASRLMAGKGPDSMFKSVELGEIRQLVEVESLQAALLEKGDRIYELEQRLMSMSKKMALSSEGSGESDAAKRVKMDETSRLDRTVSSSPSPDSDLAKQLTILQAELEQVNSVAKRRHGELEDLFKDNARLKEELDQRKEQLRRVPQEYWNDPSAMRYLADDIRRYRKDIEDASGTIKRLDREVSDMSHRHRKLISQLEHDLKGKYDGLNDFVKSAETDLVRLRKDRDSMRELYEQTNSQLSSLQKLVQQYQETAAASHSTINSLNSTVESLKDELQKVSELCQQGGNGDQAKVLAELRANEQVYIEEVENLGKTFEQLQAENDRLARRVQERDEAVSKLLAEKLKAEFAITQVQKEAELATSRAQKLDELSKHRVKEMEERESSARQQLMNLEKGLADKMVAADSYRSRLSEAVAEINALKSRYEQAAKELAEAKTMLPDSLAQNQLAFDKRRLAEELAIARKKLDAYAASGVGIVKELEEELVIYKKLMKCTACHTRDKDAVILKCMHCFCKTCLDIRLETRQRKCPNCGDSFGAGDVKQIYL